MRCQMLTIGVAQVTKTRAQCRVSNLIVLSDAPRLPAPSRKPATQFVKSANDLIGPVAFPYGSSVKPYRVAHARSAGMAALTLLDAWA